MAFLTIERGNEKGRRVDLAPGRTLVFGRDPGCDLVTTDHLVSPRHFEIYDKDGAFFVRDLDSEHGTFINEERIASKSKLRPGDVIHVGETQLSYSQGDGGAAKGAGRMVGGYRILERVGRGGMGAVYKANQVSLNRIVALKILSTRISADPAFVKRFQSEAQAAGRLNHPNIVQVYDVGVDQGVHFYSMEFIENGSVQDLATRVGALDVDLALSIATDAARGLVYAEKHGLVHRDIKPDNLMINSEGVVKIADLGLALDAGERARHAGEGSQDEEDVFGTPQFISPEQAQGLKVDTRSDIYSLGASIYRLVTGQTPFTGESIPEIVQKQIDEAPEPVRVKRPDCPPALAAIIDRAMQKDPAARFQTAQEMLTALEAADEALKGGSKRGLMVAAAVAVLAIAGGAVWFATRQKDDPRPAPVVAPDSRPETRSAGDAEALSAIERERDAARAAREASEFETEAIATGKPDLAAIRGRYHDVATRFPETPDGKQAAERVAALDAQIAEAAAAESRAAAEAESRRVRAKTVAANATQSAAAFEGSDAFSSALAVLKNGKTAVLGTEHEAALQSAMSSMLQRAEARAAKLLSDAGAAEAAGRPADAETLLADAVTAFGSGDAGMDPEIEPLATRLSEALAQARDRRTVKAREDAAHDATVVDRTRKDLYRALLAAFDPAAALGQLDAAKASLRLPPSAAAFDQDRAMIDAMGRLRDKFVASIPRDDKGVKVKLPGSADRKRLVEATLLRADKTGLTIKKGGAEAAVPFASLSAAEAYDLLFADVVAKDASLKADAIECLLFLGMADRALELADDLPDGEAKKSALARISREKEAWGLLLEIRDLAQKAQADEGVLGRLYRDVTRLIAQFADTRAYLLHRRAPAAGEAASRPKAQ
jgi:hypothetical protein